MERIAWNSGCATVPRLPNLWIAVAHIPRDIDYLPLHWLQTSQPISETLGLQSPNCHPSPLLVLSPHTTSLHLAPPCFPSSFPPFYNQIHSLPTSPAHQLPSPIPCSHSPLFHTFYT